MGTESRRITSKCTKGPDRSAVGALRAESGNANVLSLGTLGALGEVELDLLVLVQRLVAVCLDRGEVNEHVLAAAVLSDEAEALFSVEPLDSTLSHDLFPLLTLREQCAPEPLKTSTCADVQRTGKPGEQDRSRNIVCGQND